MEDSNPDSFEKRFIDNFGMTIDQFERLDFYEQENLIKKVAQLQYKIKKNEKKINKKFKIKEILFYYPIFTKTSEKRKGLFKK